jgi:drug/metabolite transporter (DMT)-like permease
MNADRLIPLGAAALGVVVTSIGLGVVSDAVLGSGAVVAGVAIFAAGYVWYRRRREQADDVRFDERLEQIAVRSGELAFRASLGLAMLLWLVVEAESVPVTAREGFVVLILGMVVARFGLYGWYNRQSV